MKKQVTRNRLWWMAGVLLLGLLVRLATKAARFLLVDAPVPSDVILVLAGETDRRPQRALELLAQGYGRRIVLDVPANSKIYEFTADSAGAEIYSGSAAGAASVSICPIDGLSTKDESKDAEKCLARAGVKSVLIVTSDFHTRRALSVFRRELPGCSYSVAAARDETQFGVRWWTHRQWAKTVVDEWLRLIWWKAVDQWR